MLLLNEGALEVRVKDEEKSYKQEEEKKPQGEKKPALSSPMKMQILSVNGDWWVNRWQ